MAEPTPTREALANELWQALLDKDDRTSPEEYPDMVLITQSEFFAALALYAAARVEAERERIAEIVKQFETPYALTNAEAFGWEHCRDKAVLAIRSGDQP